MSTIKVQNIQHTGSSTNAIALASDGTCTANLTNRTNKNLILNGACLIAQRGVSSTTNGYGSVDRFRIFFTGLDESPTQAQADVASGTTPYTSGFRKCVKVTNGNQTSGAGAGDYIVIRTTLEAQDIANSGWNYTSSSSNVTLQFWIKSSVAQNFYGRLQTQDGTTYNFPFETGSLSADTWTKITKTISGNSNLTFNNDNGGGLRVEVIPFYGTDYTASPTLDTWAAHSSSSRTPDNTSTWYTTNDATLEITGLQLEVSDHATDFEHRAFGQELALCQRYYYTTKGGNDGNPNSDFGGFFGVPLNTGAGIGIGNFPVAMRATPTIVLYDATATAGKFTQNGVNYFTGSAGTINTNGFSLISGASGVSTTTNYTLTAGFTADAEL